jgi:hypothetical protein
VTVVTAVDRLFEAHLTVASLETSIAFGGRGRSPARSRPLAPRRHGATEHASVSTVIQQDRHALRRSGS